MPMLDGVTMICQFGHRWTSTPDNQVGCPQCYMDTQRRRQQNVELATLIVDMLRPVIREILDQHRSEK